MRVKEKFFPYFFVAAVATSSTALNYIWNWLILERWKQTADRKYIKAKAKIIPN